MATKKKRPGTPREGFVMPRQGKRTMVATVPGPDEFDLDPEMADTLVPFFRLLKGNRERIRMKISMIVMTAHSPGKKKMSGTEAYLALNPDVKRTSAASAGSLCWREIEAEIGTAGMDAIDGVHVRRINRILADASGATFTRQFITRSGKIVTAPALVDHSLRFALRRIDDEKTRDRQGGRPESAARRERDFVFGRGSRECRSRFQEGAE